MAFNIYTVQFVWQVSGLVFKGFFQQRRQTFACRGNIFRMLYTGLRNSLSIQKKCRSKTNYRDYYVLIIYCKTFDDFSD